VTREEVAGRLQDISLTLRDEYGEFGEAIKVEREAKARAWKDTQTGTLGGARPNTTDSGRYMDAACLIEYGNRLDLEMRIKALEEERDHLRFIVKYGLEGAIRAPGD
jgi:hypothetical protein